MAMAAVRENLWCSCGNKLFILNLDEEVIKVIPSPPPPLPLCLTFSPDFSHSVNPPPSPLCLLSPSLRYPLTASSTCLSFFASLLTSLPLLPLWVTHALSRPLTHSSIHTINPYKIDNYVISSLRTSFSFHSTWLKLTIIRKPASSILLVTVLACGCPSGSSRQSSCSTARHWSTCKT